MRRLATVGLLCLLAGRAMAADAVTMQFGWLPGGDRAAYYLAREAGLFAAENLDVRLLAGKGSTDAITKVATGTADFGEAGLDAILTARAGTAVPIVAVMPVYTNAPDALVTTERSGIKNLADVRGKRVATSPFTSSNAVWPLVLTLNGVDPATVTLVKADAGALAPMLATGQVDGIIQYVTNAAATADLLAAAGRTAAVIPWSQFGLEGYSAAIFVADTTLATRRDVVVRFVRALAKAEAMMRDDPERAAAAVKAAVPEIDLAVTRTLVRSTVPLVFNDVTTRDGLGRFTPERVRTTWSWVARQQNWPADKLDPLAAVDLDVGRGR